MYDEGINEAKRQFDMERTEMADSEMRSMKAAVTRAKGAAFQIEDVRIGAPRHDEVLVRVVACGVCHTDIVVRDQDFQSPLPAILGHEGAGVVEAVGRTSTASHPAIMS